MPARSGLAEGKLLGAEAAEARSGRSAGATQVVGHVVLAKFVLVCCGRRVEQRLEGRVCRRTWACSGLLASQVVSVNTDWLLQVSVCVCGGVGGREGKWGLGAPLFLEKSPEISDPATAHALK